MYVYKQNMDLDIVSSIILPCWLSCATAAGNWVDTATGVTPTPVIFISAPWAVILVDCWRDC